MFGFVSQSSGAASPGADSEWQMLVDRMVLFYHRIAIILGFATATCALQVASPTKSKPIPQISPFAMSCPTRSKRARESSPEPNDVKPFQPEFERHASLWYDDGNVIAIAEDLDTGASCHASRLDSLQPWQSFLESPTSKTVACYVCRTARRMWPQCLRCFMD
ncbi:hypothetical protein FA95DRAFT_1559714 [Auriscalpium vulgare]|uniref:Uncharacterized protein n=1 Tax=Auriscalpium vulgare TaxID=40419 RepID=A0ACB8RSR4_9AGAM|nr:hypothetical protein FA95DRAFT_1559714 [Auriscalpium vulgare]